MTTGYSNDILNLKVNCDITISTVDRKYILKEYGMASDILIKTVDLSRHYQVGEEEVIALDKVNLEIERNKICAILGTSGSGKSTLLKVVSGVLKPSAGSITTRGVIAPLLELGAGFSPEYTGRENIYLYGSVLGYTKEFLDEKFDEIVDFSELGEFIEVPIKNYSSGMKSRLGFSIATIVEPDILILDEVLSVGDKKFRTKSEKKIMSMFDNGVTVLFVSHSLEQVKRLCDRAIILDSGRLVASGPVDKVARIYKNMTE